MTTAELIAMPDEDRFERWLIAGQLRERPMVWRTPAHGAASASLAYLVYSWLRSRPRPRGGAYSGAYFRLRRDPDSTIAFDLGYAGPELNSSVNKGDDFLDGLPTLAVEVIDPIDQPEELKEKVATCAEAGVPLVWIVDPVARTVTVHRPDAKPQLFNVGQELTAEPLLPGFRCSVAEIFD